DADRNPLTQADPTWHYLGAPASNPLPGKTNFTPGFPSYTSGHATFGGAALKTLANFYQTDNVAFTFTSDELNGATRDEHGPARRDRQRPPAPAAHLRHVQPGQRGERRQPRLPRHPLALRPGPGRPIGGRDRQLRLRPLPAAAARARADGDPGPRHRGPDRRL